MSFNPKTWLNGRAGNTRLDADALTDIEVRLSDYTDERVDAILQDGTIDLLEYADGEAPVKSGSTFSPTPVEVVGGISAAFRTVIDRGGQFASGTTAGTKVLLPDSVQNDNNAASARAGFRLNPADYTVEGKTTKLRIDVSAMTNNVSPGVTLTVGLYPISSVAGASGSVIVTRGTVVAGSTVAIAPSANGLEHNESAEFDCPAAGYYFLGVSVPSLTATDSGCTMRAILKQRWS